MLRRYTTRTGVTFKNFFTKTQRDYPNKLFQLIHM
jgi:hypothetical protein